MIDIHSHLLHNLDDGSRSLENSVAMARIAADDGITHMVCTPHASGAFEFSPERNERHLAELRAAIDAAGIPLALGLGCDFHISIDNLDDSHRHPTRYTINGGRYLLIELPDLALLSSLPDVFYHLRLRGMVPILTHPERNPTLLGHLERITPWVEDGMLVQVTANSFTGGMGKRAQKAAFELLRRGQVHIVATDTHNTSSRPPILSAARAVVAKRAGEEVAHRLFVEHPTAVWRNEPIEVLPPVDSSAFESKPSWWQRLFNR